MESVEVPAAEKKRWVLDDFFIIKHLGKGWLSEVYLAREKRSNRNIALKVMYRKRVEELQVEFRLVREVEIQGNLHHPNILQLYGFFYDQDRVFLVLEYAPKGELHELLEECGSFSETLSAKYIASLARALIYCHCNHVIHRDLKPQNLLIGAQDELKIADFGIAVHTFSRRRSICGIWNKLEHDASVDIWSLGVVCYTFLYGCTPFGLDSYSLKMETTDRNLNFDLKFPEIPIVSSAAKDLISKMLVEDPAQRLSLKEVLEHPWILQNGDPWSCCGCFW